MKEEDLIDHHRNLEVVSSEDTDSYITLSDSSLLTSVCEDNDLNNDFKSGFGLNPLFMEVYENKSKEISNVSDEKNSSPKLEARREKFVSTTNIVVPRPENITQIIIGDPEAKQNKRQSVLQKSVRMFKSKSRGYPGSFSKSKSEGNIKELVDNESKRSLLQSLYKGFTSMNLKSLEKRSHNLEAGFLSLREEVNHLDDNQRMICKLSQASLPPLPPASNCSDGCQASLFSCFTAGSKPIMPNHKHVLRPRDVKCRDIKERLCLRHNITFRPYLYSLKDKGCSWRLGKDKDFLGIN